MGPMADRPASSDRKDEAFWYDYLTRGDSNERRMRRLLRHLPSSPRCRLCAAPFAGPSAPLMRLVGRRQSDATPAMCDTCFRFLSRHHGGAEIKGTMLFADIRGSTTLAEEMSPGDFNALLNRFYATAAEVVFAHGGTVDKFVGDELVALFFPLLSGNDHPAQAVAAATALLRATGHAEPAGPWAPLGGGVHTGAVWLGAVGEGTHVELTAVGDAVNTAARLASRAAAGEVLVSVDAARDAGLDPTLPRQSLELKGKAAATEVVSLRVGPP